MNRSFAVLMKCENISQMLNHHQNENQKNRKREDAAESADKTKAERLRPAMRSKRQYTRNGKL